VRALLYARYSTTLQSSLSIDDQLRVCSDLVRPRRLDRRRPALRRRDLRRGARSARPQRLLAAARRRRRRRRRIASTACPATRRTSPRSSSGALRRRAHLDAVEGEVGELHIGLRGTMAAMVRKDTADKVKRGLTGRALAGMNPGGMAYGYRKVAQARRSRRAGARPARDRRGPGGVVAASSPEFAEGRSARAICGAQRRGVPSPSGGAWRMSTIHGDPKRRNGILRNDLYRGR
jgi:site-specific DNA recombinase